MTGSGEVSHNTFNAAANVQIGSHSTQNNITNYTVAVSPLDAVTDELARVVGAQWQEEAGLRRLLNPAPLPVRWRVSERQVAGGTAGATAEGARARFAPLPGLPAATGARLRGGGGLDELHQVYGGLASGRLLLVGPPAAGKTAAAVLLLLDALTYRERAAPQDRARIPVPVLLSLDGWEPERESAVDWAAGRLSREYTLLRGGQGEERARELLRDGRVALFLDGLDEVGPQLRKAVVRALEPAPFRLVLISRALEAVGVAKKARLGGSLGLELQPVRPADAAAYLLHRLPESVPPAWLRLTGRLREEPDSTVARALTSPLAISLLRDVYPEDGPVDELLDADHFPAPRAVEDHLLDRAVTAAYTPRPGQRRPPCSPETAERTLRYIAARLTEEGTRDLRWWHLPSWVDPRGRAKLWGTVVLLLYTAAGFLVLSQIMGPYWALLIGFVGANLAGGVTAWGVVVLNFPQPLPSAGWRDIFPPTAIRIGLVNWLFWGTTSWLGAWLLGIPVPVWVLYTVAATIGLAATLVSGRGYELMGDTVLGIGARHPRYEQLRRELVPRLTSETRSIGPREVWRHHAGLRLVLGILTGLAVAVFAGFTGLPFGLQSAAFTALAGGIGPVLWSGPVNNLAVTTALTAVQLSAREGTPVRLMSFLEDARRRNLLRATGPVYQFRHARLQERLARPPK
ncbi:hypothetical protein ABZ471_08245 [Streptomyces sp. NPDC005728]|uniref:hypothetical protein n=1 Tax=Streptomyces sp. NPDC005728 TaxID=3157054 RepID=UPI00340FA71B